MNEQEKVKSSNVNTAPFQRTDLDRAPKKEPVHLLDAYLVPHTGESWVFTGEVSYCGEYVYRGPPYKKVQPGSTTGERCEKCWNSPRRKP